MIGELEADGGTEGLAASERRRVSSSSFRIQTRWSSLQKVLRVIEGHLPACRCWRVPWVVAASLTASLHVEDRLLWEKSSALSRVERTSVK